MSKNQSLSPLVESAAGTKLPLLTVTTHQPAQGSGSATGNPRNKCVLNPGHSLMDWIRLGNSGVDLSGTGGRFRTVTNEELVKHNTRNDAWIAIRGVVYNVTRYMEFHPGGVEELMRGVGTDATNLFNEVHAWVNYSQLLSNCRIGPLKNILKLDAVKEKSRAHLEDQLVEPFVKLPTLMTSIDIVPRLDWIQKRNSITLYFYTKQFCNPGSLIRNLSQYNNHVEICILIGSYIHKFDLELHERIKWPPGEVKVCTESGKIEVNLEKEKQLNLWQNLGKCSRTKILSTSIENETPFEFKLLYKNKINKNSYAILLENENACFNFPVGYHVRIQGHVNGINMSKCYTPVPKKYVDRSIDIEKDMNCVNFLIKQYENPNSFSHYLCNLELRNTLNVFLAEGNLNLSTLAVHKRFGLFAAGSGLTPFLALIDHLLKRKINRPEILSLYYFNKTSTDIWCYEILHKMSLEDERFKFVNILSNAEETWTGQIGHVDTELLSSIVNKSCDNISYVAACGPSDFNKTIEEILRQLEFPKESLHIF